MSWASTQASPSSYARGAAPDVWISDSSRGDSRTIIMRDGNRISGTLWLDLRIYSITGQGEFGVLVEGLPSDRPFHAPARPASASGKN
jgi:hypothetical protein